MCVWGGWERGAGGRARLAEDHRVVGVVPRGAPLRPSVFEQLERRSPGGGGGGEGVALSEALKALECAVERVS